MKRFNLLLGVAIVLTLSALVFAAVPKLINFQGILNAGSGNPVADGSYFATFRIYDAPTGGTVLWADTQTVATSAGLFNAVLGAGEPVPDTVFNDTTRYLGITVFPDPEMTPRQRLISVSYGYRVNTVDGASGGTITSKVSIGPGHTNTGTDAFVSGANNRARGNYSVVSGGGGPSPGDSNSAIADWSTVGGGIRNTVSGAGATVAGGRVNTASGTDATVSGGIGNTANSQVATVSGGNSNTANGAYATISGGTGNTSGFLGTVSGGSNNTASGSEATISGGGNNTASGVEATIGGGRYNKAQGRYSVVAGGGGDVPADSNLALGNQSAIGGGLRNIASGANATVGGGSFNSASGNYSTIGGGAFDTANGFYSTVPGGSQNKASGSYSFAAGRRAKADHLGSFVWADSSVDADFASTGNNQFLIRAAGGVGIGIDAPTARLQAGLAGIEGTPPFIAGTQIVAQATNGGNWAHMAIISSSSGQSRLNFGDGSNDDQGSVAYNNSNDAMFFVTAAAERMRITSAGNVGIGTTTPQGALDVNSTTGAFIVPRMTTAQRNALTAVNGMIIYNTDAVAGGRFEFRENGAWVTK